MQPGPDWKRGVDVHDLLCESVHNLESEQSRLYSLVENRLSLVLRALSRFDLLMRLRSDVFAQKFLVPRSLAYVRR